MLRAACLSTTIVRDTDSLRTLSADWIELWKRCEPTTPFQRPEWLLAWAEAFDPQHLLVVELRYNQELVGLAPMFAYQLKNESILAPLGAGITDYLDWLIVPAFAEKGIALILHALAESGVDFHVIDLPDLPYWSSILRYSDGLSFRQIAQEVCPAIEFTRRAPNAAFPQRQRKNLRTAQNRTRKAGRANIEIADARTLPEFLDALFRIHSARWQSQGMPGVLSELAIQDFHQRSAPALLSADILRFYGLRFEGELIGVLHSLWGESAVYCYLQGFDPAYAFFSPGMQIIAAIVEDAVKAGKSCVDFLRGPEPYKYAWGARDRFTSRLQLRKDDISKQVHRTRAA